MSSGSRKFWTASESLVLGSGTIYSTSLEKCLAAIGEYLPPDRSTCDMVFCDLGSGNGDVVASALKSGSLKEVVGIEIRDIAYAAARRKIPTATLLHEDFFDVSWESFDILFMYSTYFPRQMLSDIYEKIRRERAQCETFVIQCGGRPVVPDRFVKIASLFGLAVGATRTDIWVYSPASPAQKAASPPPPGENADRRTLVGE